MARSYVIRRKLLGFEHADVAISYHNLGNNSYHTGDFDRAIAYYDNSLPYHDTALVIWQNVFGTEHFQIALAYHNLGKCYGALEQDSKALSFYNKALAANAYVKGDASKSYNNLLKTQAYTLAEQLSQHGKEAITVSYFTSINGAIFQSWENICQAAWRLN